MAGGGGGGEGEPEFQVAPMIDVLLTILIFFMTITSAQVLKVDKTIKLPTAPNALKKDSSRAEAILNIRWKSDAKQAEFVLDDKVYPQQAELIAALKNAKTAGEKKIAAGSNPTFRAVIRGDRELPAIYVSRGMNACAEAGISDISFSATNKD
jgi:biopolymer transport protein ExbD